MIGGPSLVGSLSSSCQRFLFCLGCSSGPLPIQNVFFLTIHYNTLFVPIVQQSGQAVVLGRLSFKKCLLVHNTHRNKKKLRTTRFYAVVGKGSTLRMLYQLTQAKPLSDTQIEKKGEKREATIPAVFADGGCERQIKKRVFSLHSIDCSSRNRLIFYDGTVKKSWSSRYLILYSKMDTVPARIICSVLIKGYPT